jgi:type I restriction enzyme M protein
MACKTSPGANGATANLGFEAKLRLATDKLRNNMDAAEYSRAERDRLPKAARRASAEALVNHVLIGLISLKYISDNPASCAEPSSMTRKRNNYRNHE